MAPTCFEQLSNFNLELGQITTFDDHRGMAVLTEGSECWNSVQEAFRAASDFVKEQLALAAKASVEAGFTEAEEIDPALEDTTGVTEEEAEAKAEDLAKEFSEATEEATGITAILKTIETYTDQEMLISIYSWDPEHVIDGESVGVCH